MIRYMEVIICLNTIENNVNVSRREATPFQKSIHYIEINVKRIWPNRVKSINCWIFPMQKYIRISRMIYYYNILCTRQCDVCFISYSDPFGHVMCSYIQYHIIRTSHPCECKDPAAAPCRVRTSCPSRVHVSVASWLHDYGSGIKVYTFFLLPTEKQSVKQKKKN